MQPQPIADYHCQTGEGPTWHPAEQRVYWVDIPNGRLFRYDPATGEHEMCFETDPETEGAIGGYTIQADGKLLLFMARGAIKLWHNGVVETTLLDEIADDRETRFNDVIADPAGRVFCGTMPIDGRDGRLYRMDFDHALTEVVAPVGVSNGLGFTRDLKQMYYTDTTAHKIYRFDYDQATGEISNQTVFVDVPREEGEGHPDGMTVDAAGYVWSARWDGHCLVRYTPEGVEERRIKFPTAKKVSSVTFGGPDYTDMYITTAGGHNKEENGEDAGALFHLNLGIPGVPEFPSRIEV